MEKVIADPGGTDAADFETLMRLARQGDKRAYEKFLKQASALLRAYVSRFIANSADREDVVQDILISLHKARHTYDGDRPFKPWLYAIAKFRLHDHLRRVYANKFRFALDIDDVQNFVENPVTKASDRDELVKDAIKVLPQKQAELLRLMHVEGYTAEEAGLKMGLNRSAAKVAAHRAYKVLRKKLSES